VRHASGVGLNSKPTVGLFIDIENLLKGGCQNDDSQSLVVSQVLQHAQSYGNVIVKRSYGDATRFATARRELHKYAVDLQDMPVSNFFKNAADIKMACDAVEICLGAGVVSPDIFIIGSRPLLPPAPSRACRSVAAPVHTSV
jgi:hypothetical protein